MRIRIVNPVVRGVLDEGSLPPLPDYVQAEIDWLEEGPSSIECRVDHALCVPPLLERVRRAAAEGVDGIVLNCFMDTGLGPARELVHVPVVGPAQSSMTLAVTLGQRFSVILPAASGKSIVFEQTRTYLEPERLASVRTIETPVAELRDRTRLVAGLVEHAELSLVKDGADVVVLGCTGMAAVTSAVRTEIAARGYDAPVLDPTLAAVGAVAAQVAAGVHHSGRAYAVPSWKSATP